MSVLDQLPQGARVCVLRLRSLGDCVLTTPALDLLKRFRPDLRISVCAEDRFAPIFEDRELVDQVLPPLWTALRRWKPQLVLNLHGGTRSQWLTALSGARWRVGFANHAITLAYNVRIRRAQRILGVQRTVHTAEHLASAVFELGVPLQNVPRARLTAGPSPVSGKYAVLHPFGSAPDKIWPAEKFCEVARYLELWNITPVFIGSQGDNLAAFRRHRISQGSLQQAKALLSHAAFFVGNDSGPAHIAAAFGVPSVVLFSTSNPAIWGPWMTECEIVVAENGMPSVSVSRVIAAIERLHTLKEAHA